MKLDKDHTGTGTHYVDFQRADKGLAAANVLITGASYRCVTGDHVGGETCPEVIVRLALNPAKNGGSDAASIAVIAKAVDNLRAGVGVHKVAGDHSGGNTCAALIGSAV